MPGPESRTCPQCGKTTHNPHDVAEGYCGFCHQWTDNKWQPTPEGGFLVAWTEDFVIDVQPQVYNWSELDRLLECINYNAKVALENADNQMRFGTTDPSGGAGRLPLTFSQWQEKRFEKWVKHYEDSLSGSVEPARNESPAHPPTRSGRGYLSTRP